jgi:hypothetical protein
MHRKSPMISPVWKSMKHHPLLMLQLWPNKPMVRSFGATVTLYEEVKLGNQLLLDLKKEYPVYEYGDRQARMKRIMNNMVSKLSNPRGLLIAFHHGYG